MFVRSGAAARRSLPLRLSLSPRPSPYIAILGASAAPVRRTISTTQPPRPCKRKDYSALAGLERNLATAAAGVQQQSSDMYDADMFQSRHELWELQPFDHTRPLIVEDGTESMAGQRVNMDGIPGHIDELLAIFDACLEVGKLQRASMALLRLQRMKILPPDRLLNLHNAYLYELVNLVQSGSVEESQEDIHKWFESHIRRQDLPHTPETVAIMLKAALLSPDAGRKQRFIDRYMSMLDADTALEQLYLANILTDQELSAVAESSPAYNMPDSVAYATAGNEGGDGVDGGDGSRGSGESAADDQTAFESKPRGLPEVLPVPQKGLGLQTLKDTLSVFSEIPEGFNIARLTKAERRELQARLERDSVDAAVNRWREENSALLEMGLNSQLSSASFGAKLYEWQVALEERIVDEINKVGAAEAAPKKSPEDLDRCLYGPFLRQSNPTRTAAVTILSILSTLAIAGIDKGAPVSPVCAKLVRAFEEDVEKQLELKTKALAEKGQRRMTRVRNGPLIKTDGANGKVIVDESADLGVRWPVGIRTKLGAFLLSALLETAKITAVREHPLTNEIVTQVQPAFNHSAFLTRGKKIGIITPNKKVAELMTREPRGDILAKHLPMVSEPEPWTKFDKGGFLESHSNLVRIKLGEKDQEHYARAAIARGDMDQVMKGLDILGKTAWKINRQVFGVMLDAWNTGKAIANLPPLDPEVEVPPEPDAGEDPTARRIWLKHVKAAENEKQGLHSVRCYMNFQMEIARAFRDQTFYFPHNIDFRGRAYPMPTYLNHMGADHTRGLLQFATGKPLGENGLRWLKIHLANVFGFDKASLDDRAEFATKHMDDIIDSATNPLNGQKWWLKGEDPWQVLAACFELKGALESADPIQYVSHLPVHQDGTCNGLQHYAALGGDTWGAKQVNLIPGDKPADIYSAVATLLQEKIVEDVANGHPFAHLLQGKITRKVVKQTVMTNVYGVTFVGARKQVAKQLNALYPELSKREDIAFDQFSSYVAANIFKALSSMFHGAHELQRWFLVIGDRVCRAVTPDQVEALMSLDDEKPKTKKRENFVAEQFHSTLVWTTPLRMPVVQPYRRTTSKDIVTCLQNIAVVVPGRFDPVNRAKQLQAFPPNFIHSLDASHMLLSALECDSMGLSFAAVHDSFWTHACDVDQMSAVIRDSFIRIHSDNITGRLLDEFQARYRGSLYLESLLKNSPAAKLIKEHRKKSGGMNLKNELIEEYERQRLLRSLDPEEVKRGREMVTPASIFESLKTGEAEVAPVDIEVLDEDGDDATESIAGATAGGVVDDIAEISEMNEGVDTIVEEQVLATKLRSEVGPDTIEKLAKGTVQKPDNTSYFAQKMKGTKKVGSDLLKKQMYYERIWLPISFPEVPKKGDFDVTQLKASKYFFS